MSKFSGFCRLLACVCLLALQVQPQLSIGGEPFTSIPPSNESVDASVELALFPWGDPQYTDGALNTYPRPAVVISSGMDGGLWITNDTWYGWQPTLGEEQSDSSTNRLLIHLDRTQSPSNLWLTPGRAACRILR